MKKFLLNPLCAGVISVLALVLFKGIDWLFYPKGSLDFYEANQGLEIVTYVLYGIAGAVLVRYASDFFKKGQKSTFWGLMFLWLVALLREIGIQHWLTKHDTTAIKIRFFTNPNNPIHEKIISGLLVILVLSVAFWLLFKYLKKMVVGFFKLDPVYWTIATFGGLGIISQVCDRFPSRYYKATGDRLDLGILEILKLLEEGGEACLPLLFALGIIQYHLLSRKQNRR